MKFSHDLYKCMKCGEFFSLPRDVVFSFDEVNCPHCGSDFYNLLPYGSFCFDNLKTIIGVIGVYNEKERRAK